MKAHYRTANGRITVEVEGDSQKILFQQIAEFQEVFEADTACGICKNTDIRFRVREVDSNLYYELACPSCFARLQFGQTKKGNRLYPKRKGDNGPLPNRGWAQWKGRATSDLPEPPEVPWEDR